MKIEILNKSKTKYVILKGDFTITALQNFQDNVFPMLKEKIDVLGIDMSDVNFIDSSGIGKLVQVANMVKKTGIKLYLVSVQDKVMKLLKSVRLDSFFSIMDKTLFKDKYFV